jgi:hypothetical protein
MINTNPKARLDETAGFRTVSDVVFNATLINEQLELLSARSLTRVHPELIKVCTSSIF